MLQFQILSGKAACTFWDARRFPVHVGRASDNHLQLEEEGVWNEHFAVALNPTEGFVLTVHPGAIVTVNQAPVASARLHNGDLIMAGAAQLCFRLSETRQRGLRVREWLVWGLVFGVLVGEAVLIRWLVT